MSQSAADDIRAYINDRFVFKSDAAEIPLDAALFGSGLLDSAHMVDIIVYLEERFGISIPSTDITSDNLETIERMAQYVQNRQSTSS